MKKILIAIDNNNIFNEIKNCGMYDVYERDIVYKEGVLEYIASHDIDLVITRDDLEGDMIKEIYVKQIRLLKPNAQLILFVKELSDTYLNFLYNNEIFNIIDIAEINVKAKMLDMIEEKTSKEHLVREECFSNKSTLNTTINVVAKKKIAVFGTSGAGKSYVSSVLANVINKKLNIKTLLVDLDVQSPAIDIYNNLNCSNNILMDIVKDVDNHTISSSTFNNNVYKKNKIDFITNNASIFEYQNTLCQRHYNKIFEIASKEYDVIISDTAANVFLDMTYLSIKNADIIIFVINPNYISIRQAIKYLDLIVNVWNIDKSKIKLVVNKITEYSLSDKQIKALLPGYDVVMQVNNDISLENVINGISNINIDMKRDYEELYKLFGISDGACSKKVETSRKNSILHSIFKKEEAV